MQFKDTCVNKKSIRLLSNVRFSIISDSSLVNISLNNYLM